MWCFTSQVASPENETYLTNSTVTPYNYWNRGCCRHFHFCIVNVKLNYIHTMKPKFYKKEKRIELGTKLATLYELLHTEEFLETNYKEMTTLSGLSTHHISILISQKIISKRKAEGHNCKYRWVGPRPNAKMVETVSNEMWKTNYNKKIDEFVDRDPLMANFELEEPNSITFVLSKEEVDLIRIGLKETIKQMKIITGKQLLSKTEHGENVSEELTTFHTLDKIEEKIENA